MSEATIRLAAFLGVLALLLAAEWLIPWNVPRPLGWRRWLPNFGLVALGAVTVRFLMPLAAVGAALWAQSRGIGLFALWLVLMQSLKLGDLAVGAAATAGATFVPQKSQRRAPNLSSTPLASCTW